MELIDTHAHLDEEHFAGDLDTVLADAATVGVRHVINIGFSPERWLTTTHLVERHEGVWCAFGLHPGHVTEGDDETIVTLRSCLAHPKALAVGEIGLDYYWTTDTKALQWTWFERQLELARELDVPVIIHQREAGDDVASILRSAPPSIVVILHSFDGAPALASLAEERGYLLGVGGLSTRQSSVSLRGILQSTPVNRLLLETDAPYLTPSGVKERRNSPANIPVIATRLAELKAMSVAEIAQATTENARRTFSKLEATVGK